MKADDIERLARAAGVEAEVHEGEWVHVRDDVTGALHEVRETLRLYTPESVARIVGLARREAREEAMDICRQHATDNGTAELIEDAIRALKD